MGYDSATAQSLPVILETTQEILEKWRKELGQGL